MHTVIVVTQNVEICFYGQQFHQLQNDEQPPLAPEQQLNTNKPRHNNMALEFHLQTSTRHKIVVVIILLR
jgi:hypothetical protein